MNAATLLGTSGPLSYYYVPGSNRTINIDPTVTAKAFLIGAGITPSPPQKFDQNGNAVLTWRGVAGGNAGAVTQLVLTDNSIYMLNQTGNLSLFNENSQIAFASVGGGNLGGSGGDYRDAQAVLMSGSPGNTGVGTLAGVGGRGATFDAQFPNSGTAGATGTSGSGYGAGGGGSQGGRFFYENSSTTFYVIPARLDGRVYGGGGGGGGGFDLERYANIPGLNSQQSSNPSLLLAISPGVPPSTAEVSIAGVGLTPNSTQNGKNYYIVKNSGNIRFNTTKPTTIYYVGAGGQGGNTTSGGNGFTGGIAHYYYNGLPREGGIYNSALEYDGASAYSLDSSHSGNVDLHGGGGGGAGGGGGGAGGVGKISITSSNYLNCTIIPDSTSVYTEDKYLGKATIGDYGLYPSYRSGNAAALTNFNPAIIGGGGGGVASTVQASGGSVLNGYTGTTVIPGSQGYRGGDGGRGQTEGFEVLHTDQYGNIIPTADRSQIALGGGGGVNAGAGGSAGDNIYTTNLNAGMNIFKQYMSTGGHVTGRDGATGTNGSGFGAGKGGKPGSGGEGILNDWSDWTNTSYYARWNNARYPTMIDLSRKYTGASGGGGGGGGNGAPGFSLDAAEGTTGLDALGDTNGCVIIVVG